MPATYKLIDPGVGITVRAYQASTIGGAKSLVDSVLASTLSTVNGKLQWVSALADDTVYSWLAAWNGSVEGQLSAVIPPANALDTVVIDNMAPRLIGDIPGCPRSQINKALRDTIRDFCRRTMAWTHELAAIAPIEAQGVYALQEHSETEITVITKALQAAATKPMRAIAAVPMGGLVANLGELYSRPSRAQICIYPAPSALAIDPILVTVSIQPTLTGTIVGREVQLRHEETFLNGARAKLMLMPNKVWSDMQAAGLFRTLYENALTDTLVDQVKGGTNEVTTINYPQFI